jgi:hypothetical protein
MIVMALRDRGAGLSEFVLDENGAGQNPATPAKERVAWCCVLMVHEAGAHH